MASCVVSNDSWMNNHIGQDPCAVVTKLYVPCSGPGFTVTLLPNNSHYTPGDETQKPTACSCSWAVYNLLQACAACQTANGVQDTTTWANWVTACSTFNTTNLLTDGTWFPDAYHPPSGTAVPYWATQDPTKWSDGRFNLTEAKGMAGVIADSTEIDALPSATSKSTSTSTSTSTSLNVPHTVTIVGAVSGSLGGIIVLLALILVLNRHLHRRRTVKLQKRHIDEEDQYISPFLMLNATPLILPATSAVNIRPKQSDQSKEPDIAHPCSIPIVTQPEGAAERGANLVPTTSSQEPPYHRHGGRVESPPAYSQIQHGDRVSS